MSCQCPKYTDLSALEIEGQETWLTQPGENGLVSYLVGSGCHGRESNLSNNTMARLVGGQSDYRLASKDE
jgi:hypothetical protein